MDDLTLVIGGTGKTGRRAAERLEAQGRPVGVGSRSSQPSFDWANRTTWGPALRGASSAYVSHYPDLAVPGAREDVGEPYELTGPRSLTFAQATEEITRACGCPISFMPVPMDAYATVAAEDGVPTDVLALRRYLFTEVLDGRNADPADGVQRALGREPRDFREFARQAAASGVWSAA